MTADLKLRPEGPLVRPCKICGGPSARFGLIDFNRSCEDHKGPVLAPAGVDVAYRRCSLCGLIFTEAMDDWSEAEFAAHIYNDDYVRVDPDFVSARAAVNVENIERLFGPEKGEIRMLDYGGGSGLLAEGLRARGFDVVTYDPFHPPHDRRPEGRFNLVTTFETIEHMADPIGGVRDIASFLDDEALVLFSTLLQPADIAKQGAGWWYAGPRNGHVTLHSQESLTRLWRSVDCQLVVLSQATHLAFRRMPAYAKRRLPKRFGGEA